ncbi:endonuclease/exonuclease/phosphatase family protein [Aureivirga sp. CE67]|uniref:endonuclease/exonuclease/phosphatase family protein n=1 Tax=Aureivirga sp. CE67 TaxID=1788983 RepID=UPI0018CAF98B|nr:endonuclease/exonuclease/phosphatase family protein [Aureivirga sp. CE67]
MKRYLLVTIIGLLAYFPAVSQKLKVGTFNAEFLNKAKVHIKFGKKFFIKDEPQDVQDFWNDDKNRTAKFEEASANVAKMIKRMDVDILTLTEVGNREELAVLKDELKKIGVDYKYYEVCDCKDRFTKQNVAVFSKYPLKDMWYEIPGRSLYFGEPDGDWEGETGISKGLKVTATIDGKEIDIFVLHFISERKGYESDMKRIAQANIARRAVVKQLNKGRNVIVTGDLNSQKKSASLYRLRGFDDIYEELIQTGQSQYFENYDVRWTYNYQGEPEQIDHILVSTGLTTKTGIKTEILETNDEKISDHNPIVVTIDLQ